MKIMMKEETLGGGQSGCLGISYRVWERGEMGMRNVQADHAEDDDEVESDDVGYAQREAEDHAEYADPVANVSSCPRCAVLALAVSRSYH